MSFEYLTIASGKYGYSGGVGSFLMTQVKDSSNTSK